MSIVTEKYLVGIMGLILVGSVIATGYLDSERRKKENVPRASEASPPLSPELQSGLKIYEKFSCAACHGPSAGKLGAPALEGQRTEYIERQLAAFAQGFRQNDIDEQMRTIASQLTSDEMHAVAEFYGRGLTAQVAGRRKYPTRGFPSGS